MPPFAETVTANANWNVPPAGRSNGPVQVRSCPLTVGSAVIPPAVVPGMYANPVGQVVGDRVQR